MKSDVLLSFVDGALLLERGTTSIPAYLVVGSTR